MICEICKSTIFCGDFPTSYKQREHHLTRGSLEASLAANCYICRNVWDRLTDDYRHRLSLQSDSFGPTHFGFYVLPIEDLDSNDPITGVRITVRCNWIDDGVPGLPPNVTFGLRPSPSQRPKNTAVTSCTGDSQTLDLVKSWLGDCLEHHSTCQQYITPNHFPTRALAIGDESSNEWRLHVRDIDGNPHEPYATLSHCWGQKVPLMLTNDTHESFRQGQQIASLPRSFRDAVHIAQSVGIRYIWIDALCILQDSEKDWAAESSQMATVYTNGRCNIAASWASCSSDGCFATRDGKAVTPALIKPEWKRCTSLEYEVCDIRFWEQQFSKATLNRRAWVLQERLLGRRQIFFGADQVIWQCQEKVACESWTDFIPHFKDPLNIDPYWTNIQDPSTMNLDFSSENRPLSLFVLLEAWAKIIQVYSRCGLTKSRDKLVAISGIAKNIQKVSKMDYYAGIWGHDIADQLNWEGTGSNTRPPNYRAPSWSWVSLDGEVRSPYIIGPNVNPDWSKQSLVDVQSIQVKPKGDDLTSEVLDASISFSGMLFPITEFGMRFPIMEFEAGPNFDDAKTEPQDPVTRQGDQSIVNFYAKTNHCEISILDQSFGCLLWADIPETVDLKRLYCLPLRYHVRRALHGISGWIRGLIVLRIENANGQIFSRFGHFRVDGSDVCESLGLNREGLGLESVTSSQERVDLVLV